MNNEVYLNHPTFGLLYRLCIVEKNQEVFTTLYAQRLFFKVITNAERITFEPLSRSDARLLVENRLRQIRRLGDWTTYQQINDIYQRTF